MSLHLRDQNVYEYVASPSDLSERNVKRKFPFSGLVTQLPQDFFSFLGELQNRMRKTIRSVGKIPHTSWRSFYNERKTEPMEGFIDGDLVETFLDLDRPIMEEIVSGMQGCISTLLLHETMSQQPTIVNHYIVKVINSVEFTL